MSWPFDAGVLLRPDNSVEVQVDGEAWWKLRQVMICREAINFQWNWSNWVRVCNAFYVAWQPVRSVVKMTKKDNDHPKSLSQDFQFVGHSTGHSTWHRRTGPRKIRNNLDQIGIPHFCFRPLDIWTRKGAEQKQPWIRYPATVLRRRASVGPCWRIWCLRWTRPRRNDDFGWELLRNVLPVFFLQMHFLYAVFGANIFTTHSSVEFWLSYRGFAHRDPRRSMIPATANPRIGWTRPRWTTRTPASRRLGETQGFLKQVVLSCFK